MKTKQYRVAYIPFRFDRQATTCWGVMCHVTAWLLDKYTWLHLMLCIHRKKYESVNVINMAFSWKMTLINSRLDKQKITFAKIINAVVLQKVHICLNLNTVLTLATNI